MSTRRAILLLCAISAWGQENKLTTTEAAKLEKTLESNPEDAAVRERLLAYYAARPDDSARTTHFHLIEWLIDNHPDSPLLRQDAAAFRAADFKPPFEGDLRAITAAWQREVEAHPNNVLVLGNAVNVLGRVNYALPADCLRRLRKIDPTNPRWVVMLASLYGAAATVSDRAPKARADLEESKDLPVIGMAGQGFYAIGNKSHVEQLSQLGEALLKRAHDLDPLNPRWSTSTAKPGLLTERDMWPYGAVPPIDVPRYAVHLAAESEASRLVHKVVAECTPGPNEACPPQATSQKLDVLIGQDGHVKYAHATAGDMSTIPSAIDAARDWVFKPAVIDGEVVEIVTEIEVPIAGPKVAAAPKGPATPSKDSKFTQPEAISKADAEYTPEAHAAKFSGSVMLSLVVDEQGQPKDIKVVRGVGLGLDQKAIEAVQKWKFRPGTKDGKPIAVPARVEVQFKAQ